MEQRLIGSLTEIYTSGGGNFLTQSRPTNFHTFFTSKVLTKGDSADGYMEVTAAERAGIEKKDAEWERPGEWLVERWNAACGQYGRYNEATGYFELNGLTDITAKEALEIDRLGTPTSSTTGYFRCHRGIRTVYPINLSLPLSGVPEFREMFQFCTGLEVVQFLSRGSIYDLHYFAYNCNRLRRLNGVMTVHNIHSSANAFYECRCLEWFMLSIISDQKKAFNLDFRDSPRLLLEPLTFLVDSSVAQSQTLTVTLHPEAYARLTDELTAKAAEKNITFATTD